MSPTAPKAKRVTAEDLDEVMNQTSRVKALRTLLGATGDRLDPLIDLAKPYIDGLDNLPADGRFLLVANHTANAMVESLLIPYVVHRELGVRVRPLVDRGMGEMRGMMADLLAAFGGVVGHPDTAAELMRHNEAMLVFPGGGREVPKFKGEEYQLNWLGRSGFARLAIEHGYPIVPVGLVGGDDIYRSITKRGSILGRLGQSLGKKLSGGSDIAFPMVRGIGATLIPRPERMYLRFGEPIQTTRPAGTDATDWEAHIKERTQTALETVLADLQELRARDPYRRLNPLSWRHAAQPEARAGLPDNVTLLPTGTA
ncbi:lysophospholipid acyltransferase family protein [Mycolicibacterium baixiangningiae]|uniref:lysophospholipid acyltransferase family protein n=1 Tax=Mycolicibacterium baixiangningiae TaxID=2761578 RepID=UPI0018D0A1FE|nr:lysophospholipid acyltransferase family protein [Mycolicibacterium baixiangningiae]